MALSFMQKLNSRDYDPTSYIQELTLLNPGVEALLQERQKVQNLAEETNAQIKKNVFKNYTQFIDTAKEISQLEGEMLQLSHLLTEQQSVINSLLDISITGKGDSSNKESPLVSPDKEEENKKALSSLLEKVEGCSALLEVGNRYIIHSGDLTEVNGVDFHPIQRVYAVLLNDSFLIATLLPHRKGPVRYRYQTLYELENLAIVNVKDDATRLKNCFKLLMFPDHRYFQCDSAFAKNEWLKHIEDTKRNKELIRNSLLNIGTSVSRSSINYHQEDDGEAEMEEEEIPDWLVELPEDLDVNIAQRDFEAAVSLIKKAERYIIQNKKKKAYKETSLRIDQRKKHLVDILTNELKISPGQSIQGGPRSARRAVTFLIRLEKSCQACELFLQHRRALLKYTLRQQQMEGATAVYVRRLAAHFFSNMQDTAREFTKAFSTRPYTASSLVVWCESQLEEFVQTFVKHVFTAQITLGLAAECIQAIRSHCLQLLDCGLDLTATLDRLLQPCVERVVTESRDKLIEATAVRAASDRWRPQNFLNKSATTRFLEEMAELGIPSLEPFVFDECFLSLTVTTTSFTKTFLHFLEELMKIHMPRLLPLVVESLASVFKAQLRHLEIALADPRFHNEERFIAWNAAFLFDTLLPLTEKRVLETYGKKSQVLHDLHLSGSQFKVILSNSSSTTVTKYSSTSFI